MKTLALSDETHRQLMEMKLQMGYKSVDELERDMISEFRKKRLDEASEWFRRGLKESGLTFRQFLKRSEKIRKELANEYDSRRS